MVFLPLLLQINELGFESTVLVSKINRRNVHMPTKMQSIVTRYHLYTSMQFWRISTHGLLILHAYADANGSCFHAAPHSWRFLNCQQPSKMSQFWTILSSQSEYFVHIIVGTLTITRDEILCFRYERRKSAAFDTNSIYSQLCILYRLIFRRRACDQIYTANTFVHLIKLRTMRTK